MNKSTANSNNWIHSFISFSNRFNKRRIKCNALCAMIVDACCLLPTTTTTTSQRNDSICTCTGIIVYATMKCAHMCLAATRSFLMLMVQVIISIIMLGKAKAKRKRRRRRKNNNNNSNWYCNERRNKQNVLKFNCRRDAYYLNDRLDEEWKKWGELCVRWMKVKMKK